MKRRLHGRGLYVGLNSVALAAALGGAVTGCGGSPKRDSGTISGAGASGAHVGDGEAGGRGGASGSGGNGTGGSTSMAGTGASSGGRGNAFAGSGGSAVQPSPMVGLRPECAEDAPKNGQACATENVQCQYGTDPRKACRPVAICKSGMWSVKVGPPSACPVLAQVDCPDLPAKLANQRCTPGSVANSGPYCAYNDVTCACDESTCNATDCAWYCDAPLAEPDCPRGQPNLGTSCPSEGLVCKYTTCEDHRCVGGYWTAVDNRVCAMTPIGH